jgi:hypothetical protein
MEDKNKEMKIERRRQKEERKKEGRQKSEK